MPAADADDALVLDGVHEKAIPILTGGSAKPRTLRVNSVGAISYRKRKIRSDLCFAVFSAGGVDLGRRGLLERLIWRSTL